MSGLNIIKLIEKRKARVEQDLRQAQERFEVFDSVEDMHLIDILEAIRDEYAALLGEIDEG